MRGSWYPVAMPSTPSPASYTPSTDRFFIPAEPTVRLVDHADQTTPTYTWEPQAEALLSGLPGSTVLTGVAGSGVTTLLSEAAAHRLKVGQSSESMLLITPNKTAATTVERQLAAALVRSQGEDYVATGKIVRSIHSVAYMIVRAAAQYQHSAIPRLMTGGEQDAVLRQLLTGQAEAGGQPWEEQWRPALTYRGFARGVRDFLLRAVERVDIDGPGDSLFDRIRTEIERLGRAEHNDLWVGAAALLEEYRQVDRLENGPRYNAAELTTQAVFLLRTDPRFRDSVCQKWSWVAVDDAQHLDPRSMELVQLIMEQADQSIVAGNPQALVFSFRGATASMLTDVSSYDRHIHLDTSHRHCEDQRVIFAPTPTQETDAIANALRRLHVEDNVAWTDMIVVVRNSGQVEPLRHRLLAADVPVYIDPGDLVLAEQPMVAAILQAVRVIIGDADTNDVLALAVGPIGAADPITLRRIYRELGGDDTSPQEQVAQILRGEAEIPESVNFGETARHMLERVREVLAAGRTAYEQGAGIETVLWELWSHTGLGSRLLTASLRGGASGSQADRDLDAMMELFDQAGDYVEWKEGATLRDFLQFIGEQELPTSIRERRTVRADAVTIDTAHAVVGRGWPVVIIPHINEGVWPSLELTGTLFDQEKFVDLVTENISTDTYIDRLRQRAQEEQRLFNAVLARATQRLILTAVRSDDAESSLPQPSPFLTSLISGAADGLRVEDAGTAEAQVLSAPTVIATLRRQLRAAEPGSDAQKRAAMSLARLAEAHFSAADPTLWWGVNGRSSASPLIPTDKPITVSPSSVEQLVTCPLRYVVQRYLSPAESTAPMRRGSILHAYAEAVTSTDDPDTRAILAERTVSAILQVDKTPVWKETTERERILRTLRRIDEFVDAHASGVDGVEVPLRASVGVSPQGHEVVLSGRADRIQRSAEDADGTPTYTIYDFKTGTSVITKKAAADHPQMKAYQLMLLAGGHPSGHPVASGGAYLVYPAKDAKSITMRNQEPLSAEEADAFATAVRTAADALAGTEVLAVANPHCGNCEIVHMCPVHATSESA